MKLFKRFLTIFILALLIIVIIAGVVVLVHICRAKKELIAQHETPKAMVCFIDDDSGKYVPEIWGPIIDSTQIKMGFACITGFMNGEKPYSEVLEQMDMSYLRRLYNEGHDVYSHTYTHQQFYVDSVTTEMIDHQCRLSKEWMISHGFTRNADILVYPGGLGRGHLRKNLYASYKIASIKDAKRDVVRKYYKYGVDAIGGMANYEPIDNYSILRLNADTASLATLIIEVDKVFDNNGLLVFMNHAYELKKDKQNQVKKMLDIIEYCQRKGVEILPLSKALQIRGNSIAVEDYSSPFSIYVSKNGFLKCGYINVSLVEALVIIIESLVLLLFISIVIFKRKRTIE